MPKLKVLVLHSKVSPAVSESELIKFANKEYDMLISTTIIESGIHIPNVNTIIIDSADRFGIADLHQLRGRVGRGKREGFCYYIIKDKNKLTDEAKKRLLALESNSYLGSGAVLAYHDLEIRGGGNLIGKAQSGHIKNIGYSLYLKMLEDAINELSNKPIDSSEKTTELKLSVRAFISDEYIAEDKTRLEIYRRLANCKEVNDVYKIEEELIDRFGKLDNNSEQFIYLSVIKILSSNKKIKIISNYNENISLAYEDGNKETLRAKSKDDDEIIKALLNYLRK